ncbi:MAG: Rieske (2Fe-2S) protein [Bacteroidota bacterium]
MEWIKVFTDSAAARSQLTPGSAWTIVAGGRKLCIGIHQDRIFAIADRCPHNGESLGKGRINHIGEVICPWHGYRFSLSSGRCSESCADAETFPVREEADGVFVAL